MQQSPSAGELGDQRLHGRSMRWTAILAVMAMSLIFAACGGADDKSDATGSSASTSASTPASTADVAEAEKYVNQWLEAPTSIGITQKLKSKPAPGKSVVFLGTNDPNNVLIQKKVKELAGMVGWKFSLIGYDPAKPNTFQSAINAALTRKPDYLVEAGLPLTPAQLKQVQDAGAKWVLDAVAPVEVKDPILTNVVGPRMQELDAKILASYFIADSKGKGSAIMESVPSYPILQSFSKAFESEVEAKCPDCKVTRVDVTLPQLAAGKVPSLMVSALRKNPDANYLVFDVGPFAGGVNAALKGAGMADKVKIIGQAADEAAIAAIKDGSNAAWTAYDTPYHGYPIMDAMFRDAEGSPISPEENEVIPTQLLTKDTVPDASTWSVPNADAQFKALWNLG